LNLSQNCRQFRDQHKDLDISEAMTDRKHHRSKRVDYSKFICQDSDDDDFTDHSYTKVTKKARLSANSSSKNEKSLQHSDRQNGIKESVVHTNTSKTNKTIAGPQNCGKENALQATSVIQSKVTKAEEVIFLQKGGNVIPLVSSVTSNVPITVGSCLDDSQDVDDTKDETKKENDSGFSSDTECTDDKIKSDVLTHTEHISAKTPPDSPVTATCKVPAKWKAPGPANRQNDKCQPKSTREEKSSQCTGLRLGLSRNIRVKPLHAIVRIPQ